MKRFYFLSTCSTCIQILKEINLPENFDLIDIKKTNIESETLDEITKIRGSYEAFFSRKAMKYKSLGLNNQKLEEQDFRKLILEEYTFLKRPVLIDGKTIFVGNSKETIGEIIDHLRI